MRAAMPGSPPVAAPPEEERRRVARLFSRAGFGASVDEIDQAAADMYALQHEVLGAQDIPIQGVGREAYRS